MSATAPPVSTDAVRRPRRSLRFARDEELVRLVRAGDERAFECIYDRHHRGILSFCRHMLGSREEAEDAVQHTFISAFRDLAGSDKPIQLKAWLYTIARNRSLSILRARREERALDDVPEPSVEGLSSQVQQRQDLRDMLSDLERLPDEQRAALVLSELGDLTHEEVAMTLDVRKDKVKALVFQARESLASSREARNADCREIQEQLSVLRGGALRRTQLRRHIDVCPACSAFKAEVQRQRAAMAIILPVTPSVALKPSALAGAAGAAKIAAGAATGGGAAAGAAGGTGAAGAGSVAAGSGASSGLLAAAGAKGLAAKVLAIAVVAGGATGGGLMAVDELSTAPADDTRPPAAVADERDSVRIVGSLRERATRVAEQRAAERAGGGATAGAGATVPAGQPSTGDRAAVRRARQRAAARAERRRRARARIRRNSVAGAPATSPAPAGAAPAAPGAGSAAPDGSGAARPDAGKAEGPKKDKNAKDDKPKDQSNGNGNPAPGTPRRGSVGNSPATPPGQQRRAPRRDRARPKAVAPGTSPAPAPAQPVPPGGDGAKDKGKDTDGKGPKARAAALVEDVQDTVQGAAGPLRG
jgi:RNA polymerase sigma factor (sigma-70 family)